MIVGPVRKDRFATQVYMFGVEGGGYTRRIRQARMDWVRGWGARTVRKGEVWVSQSVELTGWNTKVGAQEYR